MRIATGALHPRNNTVQETRCAAGPPIYLYGRTTLSAQCGGFLAVRRGGALLPTVVAANRLALPQNRLASSATGGASAISPPAGDREDRPYGVQQEVRYRWAG